MSGSLSLEGMERVALAPRGHQGGWGHQGPVGLTVWAAAGHPDHQDHEDLVVREDHQDAVESGGQEDHLARLACLGTMDWQEHLVVLVAWDHRAKSDHQDHEERLVAQGQPAYAGLRAWMVQPAPLGHQVPKDTLARGGRREVAGSLGHQDQPVHPVIPGGWEQKETLVLVGCRAVKA